MAKQRQSHEQRVFTAENEIDQVLGNANPNPARAGCPPQDVLVALARRQRLADDPAYDHLIKCSPCYREVRALQQAAGERRVETTSRAWWSAAAALVLVLGGAAWLVLSRSDDQSVPQAPQQTAALSSDVTVQADLRKYTVLRSDERQTQPEPVALPRSRVKLTLLLPVGYDAGNYELQVLDAQLGSRATAAGRAEIRDFVTTLEAAIDLGSLPPGSYQLAIRREGEDWRLFPAEVK
jgi:hypothetical protein